jgi:subfamily B ATP-binding cassette protein MsbA
LGRSVRIISRLSDVGGWKVALVLLLTLAATFFEGFSIAMLLPVMEFIEKGGDLAVLSGAGGYWTYLIAFAEWLSVPVSLLTLVSAVFLLLLLRQGFTYARTIYSFWLSTAILSDIRRNGFRWLLLATIEFHAKMGSGRAISVMTIDGERAATTFLAFFRLASGLLIFGGYITLLAFISPGMMLIATLVMSLMGLLMRARVRLCQDLGVDISDSNNTFSKILIERLNGIRVIKLAGSEKRETALFEEVTLRLQNLRYRAHRVVARVETVVDPLVMGAALVILYVAVEIYGMAMAQIGVFLLVLLRLLPYAKEIVKSRQQLGTLVGSLSAVTDFLSQAERANTIRGGTRPLSRPEREILFDGVTFSYAKSGSPALKDVTLSIQAGKMTALIGRSGAGKSTLVDLIPRLREPQRGRILIDGRAIEEYSLTDLRRAIAFVPQDSFLFDDTVGNNIRFVRPEAGQEKIERAAQQAYADIFIRNLPEGYDTRIGERGVRLSGGERQRIVLARALLQEAPVVVLDEPTSALDSDSERYIQRAMAKIRASGRTTLIVIAHRLSTIKTADQIIILKDGEVAGIGRHQELLDEIEWYADVVTAQTMT